MSPHEVLSNPNWFPVHFDINKDSLTFLKTTREALSAAAFLDQRFYTPNDEFQTVRLTDAIASKTGHAPISWIFHTAFCCSTLMARALDRPGKVLSLKEPDILKQLANARRMAGQNGHSESQISETEKLVLNLLGRRFSSQEQIVIKPTNPANPIIKLALASADSCLLMTSPLDDFLVSVIKKGEGCRGFVRTLYNIFSLDMTGLSHLPQRQAMTFTDLQVAVLVWQHQLEELTASAQQFPHNVRAIDGSRLPASPAKYLSAASQFLGLGLTDADISDQANGSIFKTNSKFSDISYDNSVRANEADDIRALHHEAIETVIKWQSTIDIGRVYRFLPAQALV